MVIFIYVIVSLVCKLAVFKRERERGFLTVCVIYFYRVLLIYVIYT